MNFIRVLYILALGLSLTFVVAFGTSTFYEEPQMRPGEVGLAKPYPAPPTPESPEYKAWEQEQGELEAKSAEEWKAFEASQKAHSRNVFFIAYPLSLLFVALGSLLNARLDLIRAGLVLGGIGTMIFGLAQGGLANEWRFIGSTVSSAVLVYLGYRFLVERKASKAEG